MSRKTHDKNVPAASLAINLGIARVATKFNLRDEDVARILEDLKKAYEPPLDLSVETIERKN